MIALILFLSIVILSFAYVLYGNKISKLFDLKEENQTPAHSQRDDVDYVPTATPVLLGHHFASIAGAGPIVGPIIAALAFGWFPVLCWIIVGAIFIGGIHDVTSLVASIRHRAKSIAEVAKENMSLRAYLLFLVFIWLALVYVITVFLDLTSTTFSLDGSAATASVLFIFVALAFGYVSYAKKMPFSFCTVIFVSLLMASIWLGNSYPMPLLLPLSGAMNNKKLWDLILLGYCFMASITPVWLLLQPRDYLSSFCLYASVIGALLGIMFGGFSMKFPAFIALRAGAHEILYPLLFINVACGACSGFHSLVSSGTTSKQLNKETDAVRVGYGAMLIEAVVAVIALCTVMIIGKGDVLAGKSPLIIYSAGLGNIFAILGLSPALGKSFALLAISTFILTTLDTSTRLGRYVLEEIYQSLNCKVNRHISTFITLLIPAIFVLVTLKDSHGNPIPAWKAIWPVFGATNQLLAALTLLTVSVWLKRSKKNYLITLVPMMFMLITSMWALVLIILQYSLSVIGIIACTLFCLGGVFCAEGFTVFFVQKNTDSITL